MSEENVRICKKCAHYRPAAMPISSLLAKCNANHDPVTGGPRDFCGISRNYGPCYVDGRLWKEKPPGLVVRIVRWLRAGR